MRQRSSDTKQTDIVCRKGEVGRKLNEINQIKTRKVHKTNSYICHLQTMKRNSHNNLFLTIQRITSRFSQI